MSNTSDPSAKNSESGLSSDELAYVRYGEELRDAALSALGPWLTSVLQQRCRNTELAPELVTGIAAVQQDARDRLDTLIYADVDAPLSGPLERLRQSAEPLGPMLDELGVPRPVRDPFDVRQRPDDWYALGPFAFADLGPAVHEAGMAWGAAKAFLHRSRRQ